MVLAHLSEQVWSGHGSCGANRKFEHGFRRLESVLDDAGTRAQGAGLDTHDRLWDQVKAEERRRRGVPGDDG